MPKSVQIGTLLAKPCLCGNRNCFKQFEDDRAAVVAERNRFQALEPHRKETDAEI